MIVFREKKLKNILKAEKKLVVLKLDDENNFRNSKLPKFTVTKKSRLNLSDPRCSRMRKVNRNHEVMNSNVITNYYD